jgi:hypothetical protein
MIMSDPAIPSAGHNPPASPAANGKVSVNEVYVALIQLQIHAETITWNRFNNFLVFNSILIMAWATVYAPDKHAYSCRAVLVVLCAFGMLSSVVWCIIGYRGRKYLNLFMRLGKKFEKGSARWNSHLKKFKLTRAALKLGNSLHTCGVNSNRLLTIGPLVLLALHGALLLITLLHRHNTTP